MKRALRIALIALVILIGAAIAAPFLIPTQKLIKVAQNQISSITGRTLTIGGEVSPTLFPVIGVEVNDVSLSNAKWAAEPLMVSAASAKIGVELAPLLSGKVVIDEIRLIDPTVNLEVRKDGTANWTFPPADAAKAESGAESGDTPQTMESDDGGRGLAGLTIGSAVVENGSLNFVDNASGNRINAARINATASVTSPDAPLSASGSAVWNDAKADFNLKLTTLASLRKGAPTQIDMSLTSDPAKVSVTGSASAPRNGAYPVVDAVVTVKSGDVSRAMAWLTGETMAPALADIGEGEAAVTIKMNPDTLDAKIKGAMTYNSRQMTLTAHAGGGADWANGSAIALNLRAAGAELFETTYDGTLAITPTGPKGDGDFTFASSNPRQLAEWAGAPPLPAPQDTLKSVSIKGRLSAGKGPSIRLGNAEIKIDDAVATGMVGADLGSAKPYASADLSVDTLDLRPFIGGADTRGSSSGGSGSGRAGSGGSDSGGGWSDAPIDTSGLRAVDADIKIAAQKILLPKGALGPTKITAALKDGALTLDIPALALYHGGASGKITLNARKTLAINADISVDGVQIHPLLSEVADIDSLEGLGRVKVKLKATGASQKALMESLGGSGLMLLSDGAIRGVNLAAMARNAGGAFTSETAAQKTDFSELSGSFTIDKGVLDNKDMKLLGPLIRGVGAGQVNIARQTLDYRVTPKVVSTLARQGGKSNLAGIAVPILVTGSWSNPKFAPDLGGAAKNLIANPEKILKGAAGSDDALKKAVKNPGAALKGLLGGFKRN